MSLPSMHFIFLLNINLLLFLFPSLSSSYSSGSLIPQQNNDKNDYFGATSSNSTMSYYISCHNGSDSNHGHSALSPLATFEELSSRLMAHCDTQKQKKGEKVSASIFALSSSTCFFSLRETLTLNASMNCFSNLQFSTIGNDGEVILSGGKSIEFLPLQKKNKISLQKSNSLRHKDTSDGHDDGVKLVESFLPNAVFRQEFIWSMWYLPDDNGNGRNKKYPSKQKMDSSTTQSYQSQRLFVLTTPILHYEKIQYPSPSASSPVNQTKIYLSKNEISPLWNISSSEGSLLSRMYIRIYHSWTSSENKIHSWNRTSGVLTIAGVLKDHFQTASGNRYALMNYLSCDDEEALVSKSSDRKNNKLFSFPTGSYLVCPYNQSHRRVIASVTRGKEIQQAAGSQRQSVSLIVPHLSTILFISQENSNFQFDDFVFAHTTALVDETCLGGCGQSGSSLPSAALMVHGQHVMFKRVKVVHTGSYAVWINEGAQFVEVAYSHIVDLGAGGVRIGAAAGGTAANPSTLAQSIILRDSVIAHSGFVTEAGAGVLLQQAARVVIQHNTIQHLKYTGVSTGWTWNYAPTSNRDNYVGYNLIHDIGQGILSDMGCIYNLGINTNSLFENNLCYNVWSFGYGGWGLYSDQGSTDITWRKNIVYQTTGAGYHHHWGENVTLENNIFALPFSSARNWQSDKACIRADPGTIPSNFISRRNICFQSNVNSTLFFGQWVDFKSAQFNDNIYWNEEKGNDTQRYHFPTNFSSANGFKEWQNGDGKDRDSLIADPQFPNWRKLDFSSILATSPALKLGFRPINVSSVGPQL